MRRMSLNLAVSLAVAAATCLSLAPRSAGAQGSLPQLQADFTFSGTFEPAPADTNKDGLPAEKVTATVKGILTGRGAGTLQPSRLRGYASVVEYGLASPSDAFTSCFRVNETDFSVQEDAYLGPIAHLIRPIRDPVVNPTSMPYSAEEWTAFYQLESGELLYAQVTELEICVENTRPVPLCHVRQREEIVGGTGRFKHATGDVTFTAIAPTYTSDAALLAEDGSIDITRRPPSFAVGPIYGAGQINVLVPPLMQE